jgi:predicted nuclease with TOPRIM domain
MMEVKSQLAENTALTRELHSRLEAHTDDHKESKDRIERLEKKAAKVEGMFSLVAIIGSLAAAVAAVKKLF